MTQQTQSAIIGLLAASGPCTLEDLLEEVRVQCGIKRQVLLPAVITALAALMEQGTISEYEQMPLDHPLEYAWELADAEAQAVKLSAVATTPT